jgi:exonuclease III
MAGTPIPTIVAVTLSVFSLNIGGNSTVFGGLLNFLRRDKPDLVFLQEVSVGQEALEDTVRRYGYLASVNVEISGGKGLGVATLWKEEMEVEVKTVCVDRIQEARFCGHTFLNVYGPAGTGKNSGWEKRLFLW